MLIRKTILVLKTSVWHLNIDSITNRSVYEVGGFEEAHLLPGKIKVYLGLTYVDVGILKNVERTCLWFSDSHNI